MKYGPQTREIEELLSKLENITPEQAEALDAAWAAWDAAWAARDAAWGAAWDAAWGAAREAAWDAAWDAARHAARDAVLALLVKDLISEGHFQTLYGPWRSVMD